jgi:alkyl hydroperoxide reductase subunit AhpF
LSERLLSMAIPSIEVGPIVSTGGPGAPEEIKLLLFIEKESLVSKELVDFASSFVASHPNVKMETMDWEGGRNERLRSLHIEYAPCMVLVKGEFARIRYFGVPTGYEAGPFSDAVYDLSHSSTKLAASSKSALVNVRRRANIKVFVLPTCTFCPIVARHAYRVAIESKMVTTEIIDSSVFTELSQKHLVQGVPKVLLNDITDITGAMNESVFIEKLREADHALIDSMFG